MADSQNEYSSVEVSTDNGRLLNNKQRVLAISLGVVIPLIVVGVVVLVVFLRRRSVRKYVRSQMNTAHPTLTQIEGSD